ncbi:Kinesin motor domain [Phytophthora infestans]|uniref:Kinesin-like protein n=1 Tax=Phytophthora infestans TaxID=4787 RepID=A0A833SND2_PHYIN|nr:Kinesin motor domain [Phytophthora infestans]
MPNAHVMDSRSSLRQLHQQLGDLSLAGHAMVGSLRTNGLTLNIQDKRATPPLPSLPPWAGTNQSLQKRRDSREEHIQVEALPSVSQPVGWRKPRPYFMQLKQLSTNDPNVEENQKDHENEVPEDHQPTENQQAESVPYDPNPGQHTDMMKVTCRADEEDEATSSGSGSEPNQQEHRTPLRRSPLRGQFIRPWKIIPPDEGTNEDWSPSSSNKWKERAILDPFARRRTRLKSIQPRSRTQSPPELPPPGRVSELPRVQSPIKRSNELKSTPRVSSVSISPRPKAPPTPLNPLRLSSADKIRAGLRPSSPPRTLHSARDRLSRDSLTEEQKQDKQESERLSPLTCQRQAKAINRPLKPKKSTMNALNEIKRKREARRAQQAEEKRRVEKELKEHGDDAGYKFRRLIQQYRDALPPTQQQQETLQQLPLLSLTASIQPPPTPATLVKAAEAPRLSVFIRKRPLAKKERKKKGYDIISCLFASQDESANKTRRELVCHEPKLRVDLSETLENHQFRFDGVFDEWQENSKIYDATVGPMVPYLVSEATASNDTTSLTVFAYGQTGSGKTYTMKSIYRQAAVDLFHHLDELKATSSRRNSRITAGVSFYEIYMNNVNDLLNGRARVQLMEDGDGAVQLPGLKELPATNADELLELVQRGEQARATSANAVHDDSSRSHALLRVTLYAEDHNAALARLSMVDLAGSERASDTQSDKKNTRMEGAEINKSLLALKECIRALDRGATHIPFRQSKLTQLLRDSFLSQNSKTIMIATISPCSESCNHTLNTLRYADRLKEIGAAS